MNRSIGLFAFCCAMVSVITGCGGGGGSSGDSSGPVTTSVHCAQLLGKSYGGAQISSAVLLSGAVNGSPIEFCSVGGMIGTQMQIELRLPTLWSQRYIHIGGGNFDGVLPNLDTDGAGALTAVVRGYAVAASNGGHIGNPSTPGGASFDETWALNNTPSVLDFEYRAIGTLDVAANAIIVAYYDSRPQYSYFSGCSTGGREAINAAIHFPQNYDGVIAGAPAVSSAGLTTARTLIHNQLFGAPGNNLTLAKVSLVTSATLAACDALDGVADGIISDPDACHFDPGTLRCPGGDSPSCLTDAQIRSVNTIRGDTKLSDGTVVYRGFGLGAEDLSPDNWQTFFTDGSPTYPAPESFLIANATLTYIVFNKPAYNSSTFNIDRDYPTVLQTLTSVGANTIAADLVPFASAGKKLLIWQGESDYSLSTNATIAFYGDATSAARSSGAAAAFAQMYVLPGVQHCNEGGPGAGTFDKIGAMTDWVEKGNAPQVLQASSVASTPGATTITRPMCPYPQYPRYVGSGDNSKAQNFVCASN